MAKKSVKTKKTVDIEQIKGGLDSLIKERDPLQKWLPFLNELKPKIDEAVKQGCSISSIRNAMKIGGLNVPQDVLKKFVGP